MNSYFRKTGTFKKVLNGILPIFFGIGAVWTAVDIYFDHRIEGMHHLRRLTDEVHINALEMKREQYEFFLQDVHDLKFYRTGTSNNIRDQAVFHATAVKGIEELRKGLPKQLESDLLLLEAELNRTDKIFWQLVSLYHRQGIAGTSSQTKAMVALMNDLYESILPIGPLVSRLTDEVDGFAASEVRVAKFISFLILSFSILLGYLFFRHLAHTVAEPLADLRNKVSRFRDTRDVFEPSQYKVEEFRLLDEVFCETIKNLGQTQQQLLQAQKMESVGTLAGGIAHDFNNLLAGILAYAGILKRRLVSDSVALREVEIIEQSANRGAELTRQLLGFARKGKYDKTKFDVNKTILECRNLLYRTVDKTVTIRADLGKELDLIVGDAGQILQTLMNLGVNARDAMPGGGDLLFESQVIDADEHFCKTHGQLKPGRYVRISVSDTGTGMPKSVQDKIFDPFFTTKEVGKGTGLGLAMVYGIMQNHGGMVSVYSELGHGTCFHLYFPAVAKVTTQSAELKTITDPTTVQPADRLQGQMILVVDDEALMRSLAKDILEPQGATLFFASDGQEALDFLKVNHSVVNAVLLDVIMPRMDGIKTYGEIRKMNPDLTVVLSSGYAESNAIVELRQKFEIGFIQKPYQAEDLIALIRGQIEKSDSSERKSA